MKRIVLVVLTLLFVFIPLSNVLASDSTAQSVPYYVQAVFPENQISDLGYFNIGMDAGQKQLLEVTIVNTSNQAIKVAVSANTGTTNRNGLITYDGSTDSVQDESIPIFEDIAKLTEDVVEVPAKSEASAFLEVVAPNEAYLGEILGGLYFELIKDEDPKDEGVTISNNYAYVIGVLISDSESKTEIEAEIVLKNANLEEISKRPAIQTTFVNESPVLVGTLMAQGQVFAVDDMETVLEERTIENFSVAPNNEFNFPIFCENGLEEGEYLVKITLQNEEFHWEFEEKIIISEQ